MLDGSADCFRSLFTLLADARSYPLVVHCTYGRDRTGIAAVLILLTAGVSRDDVVADFIVSNEYLRARWDAKRVLEIKPSHLLSALDHLDEKYGGVEAYLQAVGIGRGQLAAFRRLFVVPDRSA